MILRERILACVFILDAAPVRKTETCYAAGHSESIRYRSASGRSDQATGGGCEHDSAIALCELREIVCSLVSSLGLEYEVS